MNRHSFTIAFALGAAAILWIAGGFLLSLHLVALLMTLLIGAVYAYGAAELHRFRQSTATLTAALSAIPDPLPSLEAWLGSIHTSLQNPVRMRIEGERHGLPGPALTPYLVGLLVMLGMLGTFLGMVVTLNGAVFALEGTTDLQAIRSAFAAPIKGLGLSFGTSVAGVASSAMLGLMSAISRRERMVAAQLLDTRTVTVLRSHSLTFQRQEAFKALQMQTQALPMVVDRLQAMMDHMESMSQQLNERLLTSQDNFHSHVQSAYTALANSVDATLRSSLVQGASAAGESIRPIVAEAMAASARDAGLLHERLVQTTQAQLQALTEATQQQWQTALQHNQDQQQTICTTLEKTAQQITQQTQDSAQKTLEKLEHLATGSEALAQSRMSAEDAWHTQQSERMAQLTSTLQADLTGHLSALGNALEEPITRLIQTASEAPRAAADVIASLRHEMTHSVTRDNELLQERSRILETLNTLLGELNHTTTAQRSVIDALVVNADETLTRSGQQFATRLEFEVAKLADAAVHVTSGAVEVASLGDTLGFAVQSFSDANDKLIANLQRVEHALDKSMARSDDQLAYYVAQAREVIDLSIVSQKDIVDELRKLSDQQKLLTAEEVAG